MLAVGTGLPDGPGLADEPEEGLGLAEGQGLTEGLKLLHGWCSYGSIVGIAKSFVVRAWLQVDWVWDGVAPVGARGTSAVSLFCCSSCSKL